MSNTPPDVEFLPPEGFTPHVRTPGWVVYAPLSPQAHAAAGYLYGHVNPDDGTFTVIPSHAKIAKYLGVKAANSARKYVNELKDAGVLDSILTFYDRKAGRRTTQRVRDDGVKNDQTSNTYRLRWSPPQGRMHPGPMNSDEWHHPDKIKERLRKEGGRQQADSPTPLQHSEGGRDQAKQEFPQVVPPLNTVQGPPSTECGDPPHSVEDEVEQEKKNKNQPTSARADDDVPAAPVDPGTGDGWLDRSAEEDDDEEQPATGAATGHELDSVGASLLRSLGITGKAVDDWSPVVEDALSKLGEHETRKTLTSKLDNTERPAGVIISRRLPQLRGQLSSAWSASSTAQERPGLPPECGECTDRWVTREDGLAPCPQCHPSRQGTPTAA